MIFAHTLYACGGQRVARFAVGDLDRDEVRVWAIGLRGGVITAARVSRKDLVRFARAILEDQQVPGSM